MRPPEACTVKDKKESMVFQANATFLDKNLLPLKMEPFIVVIKDYV